MKNRFVDLPAARQQLRLQESTRISQRGSAAFEAAPDGWKYIPADRLEISPRDDHSCAPPSAWNEDSNSLRSTRLCNSSKRSSTNASSCWTSSSGTLHSLRAAIHSQEDRSATRPAPRFDTLNAAQIASAWSRA